MSNRSTSLSSSSLSVSSTKSKSSVLSGLLAKKSASAQSGKTVDPRLIRTVSTKSDTSQTAESEEFTYDHTKPAGTRHSEGAIIQDFHDLVEYSSGMFDALK